MRDWMATLWRASFRGRSFWVSEDSEKGGRRLDVHEFPMRDAPFVEDLGSSARRYSVTAYLGGDTADAEAAALVAALDQRGAGVLVLPDKGSLSVRCEEFDRKFQKDELGRVVIDIVFVREGAPAALVSSTAFASRALDAAESLAATIVTTVLAATSVKGMVDFVVASARDGVTDAFAGLEAVRSGEAVSVEASASARTALDLAVADIPVLVTAGAGLAASLPERVVSIARSLGEGMVPAAAIVVFAALADADVPTFPARRTALARLADGNAAEMARLARLAALTAYAEALVLADYPSRREAIAARAAAAERFEAEMGRCDGALDAALYRALDEARGRVIDHLSRVVIDAAPVMTVEAAIEMPAIVMAYRLYEDPARADELVTRNRVKHPQFMPLTFEALAS